MKAEYEELKHLLRVVQKDLSTTDKHHKLTWQELQKVSAERNQVSFNPNTSEKILYYCVGFDTFTATSAKDFRILQNVPQDIKR